MTTSYLSANRALLSRYRPSEIIYFNLSRRFVERLQAGQGVSMLDNPFRILASLVPFAIGTAFAGVSGFIVGGGITLFALMRLAVTADKLDRLWRQGILIEAKNVEIESVTVKDEDGDYTEYQVHYFFSTPHGAVRGRRRFRHLWGDPQVVLMLYRSPTENLII